MTHIIEGTSFVILFHTKITTKLIDFGIFDVESVDKGVEVFQCFVILLHLVKSDGTKQICFCVRGVSCNSLSGLGDYFDG